MARHENTPLALTLHCPLCGDALSVHSPTLCRAAEIHSKTCRPVASRRRDFVIAEDPDMRPTRANQYYTEILRLHAVLAHTDSRKSALAEQVAELTAKLEASAAAMDALQSEHAALQASERTAKATAAAATALQNENAALRAECDRLRARVAATTATTATAPPIDLVRALKRIATAPSRRRKLMALLHPDQLRDSTLFVHAKCVRDAVLG